MSSEKKHYWLVSYIGSGKQGGSVHGSLTYWSSNKYFSSKSQQQAQANIPENCVFVSVSYLGEMTEQEWKGEE